MHVARVRLFILTYLLDIPNETIREMTKFEVLRRTSAHTTLKALFYSLNFYSVHAI